MFYSLEILSKKTALGTLWFAGTMRKVTKKRALDADIRSMSNSLIKPQRAMAVRLHGTLLLGLVLVYSHKVKYLYSDAQEMLVKVQLSFTNANIDLPNDHLVARYDNITIQIAEQSRYIDRRLSRLVGPLFQDAVDFDVDGPVDMQAIDMDRAVASGGILFTQPWSKGATQQQQQQQHDPRLQQLRKSGDLPLNSRIDMKKRKVFEEEEDDSGINEALGGGLKKGQRKRTDGEGGPDVALNDGIDLFFEGGPNPASNGSIVDNNIDIFDGGIDDFFFGAGGGAVEDDGEGYDVTKMAQLGNYDRTAAGADASRRGRRRRGVVATLLANWVDKETELTRAVIKNSLDNTADIVRAASVNFAAAIAGLVRSRSAAAAGDGDEIGVPKMLGDAAMADQANLSSHGGTNAKTKLLLQAQARYFQRKRQEFAEKNSATLGGMPTAAGKRPRMSNASADGDDGAVPDMIDRLYFGIDDIDVLAPEIPRKNRASGGESGGGGDSGDTGVELMRGGYDGGSSGVNSRDDLDKIFGMTANEHALFLHANTKNRISLPGPARPSVGGGRRSILNADQISNPGSSSRSHSRSNSPHSSSGAGSGLGSDLNLSPIAIDKQLAPIREEDDDAGDAKKKKKKPSAAAAPDSFPSEMVLLSQTQQHQAAANVIANLDVYAQRFLLFLQDAKAQVITERPDHSEVNATVSFLNLTAKAKRNSAARAFFNLLVLHSKKLVALQQHGFFTDISITVLA